MVQRHDSFDGFGSIHLENAGFDLLMIHPEGFRTINLSFDGSME